MNISKYSKNITTIGNSSKGIKYKLILPQIESISPQKTILSGGTKIKITGNNLHCGSFKEIYFGDKKCNLIERSNEKYVFLLF